MNLTAARRAARDQLPALLIVAGLAVLVSCVLYLDTKPLLILAVPAGVVCLWIAAQFPVVSLVVMVVAEVTNVSGVLAPSANLPLFQASMLLGVAALAVALRSPDARARLNHWTLVAGLLLLGYVITLSLATIGSTDVVVSIATLTRAAIDCSFVMIVLMLIQVTGGVWIAVAAMVIPMAVMSFLTLVNQIAFHGTFPFGGFAQVTEAYGEAITTLRYGGPLPDSNFWGRHLVMGLPLAGALAVRAWRNRATPQAAGWAAAAISILAGIYLTQSRGTFLATLVMLAVWAIACGPTARRWALLAAPPLAIAVLLAPGIGDRLTSAADEVGRAGGTTATIDPSILGRLASQEMASLMFQNRPIFGYGPGTFAEHTDEFSGLVPTAILPQQAIEAPHNLYLQAGAESGILGIVGWTVLVLGFLTIPLLRLTARPRAPDRVLTAAVIAAIVAWSAASVTLHLAYFRTFGIVLALAAALAPQWPAKAALRDLSRTAGIWLVAGALGAGAAWSVAAATAAPATTASQTVAMTPVGDVDGYYLYAMDIRTRTAFYPTLAVLLTPDDTDVKVTADIVRGTMTFSATTPDRAQAVTEVTDAVATAKATTTEHLAGSYSLTTVDEVRTAAVSTRSTAAEVAAIVAGVLVALIAWLFLRRLAAPWRESSRRTGSEVTDREGVSA